MSSDDTARRDVFVSHASEDKEAIARPLAAQLRRDGFTVWFDEYELVLGDSLHTKIGDGLSHSRVGVVILSPNFFAKQWSQWELRGLTARQIAGEQNVILPVWHGVGIDEVRSYSPPLADLVAARSTDGVREVADAVGRVVRMRAAGAAPKAALETAGDSKRRRVRARPAAGAGALAVVAVTGLLVATDPFGGGGDRSGTTQSTTRSAFVLPSGRVTLDRRPRDKVGQCFLFEGHAQLKAGRTLVIGAQRVNPPDSERFYQKVTWRGDDGRSAWWAARSFGSTPGQTFRVTVVGVPATAAVSIENSRRLPRDRELVTLRPDLLQTSSANGCRGAGTGR